MFLVELLLSDLCFSSSKVYKAINVHVALTGLEIWSDGDKIEINEAAGVTLDRFSEWRQSVLLKRKRNDNAQLLTYVSHLQKEVGEARCRTLREGSKRVS